MSDSQVIDLSDRDTQFSSHESDAEHLYDAVEIVAEKRGLYLVKWDGVDPTTGKPWPNSWTHKRDCTDDLVQAWKLKQSRKRREAQQGKANKKTERTRKSTTTRASTVSTSRPVDSAATSRSTRSKTVVHEKSDSEPEFESISRTPANKKKRRLSKTPAKSGAGDSSPPTAPPRPLKKRRVSVELVPDDASQTDADADDESPPARSPKKAMRVVDSSDDDLPATALPNGKGKVVDRNPTKQSNKPSTKPKKTSLLQRHLDRHLDDAYDSSGDEIPALKRNVLKSPPSPARLSTPRPTGRIFDLDRDNTLTQTQSNILSPRAQARLDQFDREIAERSQDGSMDKIPLFLPDPSGESDHLPVSPSETRSYNQFPHHPTPPRSPSQSRSPSPVYRGASPSVSDFAREPSPLRATSKKPRSTRRAMDDSYRVGVVPETQSSPESPPPPPPQPSPPKMSVISRMKPRSKTSTLASLAFVQVDAHDLHAGGAGGKPLGPLPRLSPSAFAPHLSQRPDADAEEADELMSSIEQFSSPVKGSGAAKKSKGADWGPKGKGKGRQHNGSEDGDEDEGEDEDDEEHARVVARGVEMADAARAERRARMMEYEDGWKGKPKMTLNQIFKQRESGGVSMDATESDVPLPSTANGAGARFGVEPLRQEEEESTQDLLEEYRAAEDAASGVGDRSEAGQSDVDGHLDPDGAERSAWLEEQQASQRASQEQQDADQGATDDRMQDDSMDDDMLQNADLAYPPDEEEPVPEEVRPVTNGHIARASKSRSTSARPKKPAEDELELPPTASTRQNTPEPNPTPAEVPVDPRHLAAMSLLNAKSDENHRLEALLAEQRALVESEKAKNAALQERITALELQATSASNDDIVTRLKEAEAHLTTSLATALRDKASAEAERDSARRDQAAAEQQRDLFREYYGKASQFAGEKGTENKELEKRVAIAEEATREGIATIRATFDLRETALKFDARDWRNQANFLREQAIRTNDEDLRQRAADHPEVVARCNRLEYANEGLRGKVNCREEDIRVKQDEIERLEAMSIQADAEVARLNAALGALRAEKREVSPKDSLVFPCKWRDSDTNIRCRAFFMDEDEMEAHATMHCRTLAQAPTVPY